MLITRTSMLSGITRTQDIAATQEEINAWKNGMYIQVALPNLTNSEREFIKTGITDEEWDKQFKEN